MSDDEPKLKPAVLTETEQLSTKPRAYAGCKCACHEHEFNHVRHVLPCCGPSWTRKPKGNEL